MPKKAAPYTPSTVVGQNLLALLRADQPGVEVPQVTPWAEKLKLSQTTLSRILRDRLDPTTRMLGEIANALGVPTWSLLIPPGGARQSLADLNGFEGQLITLFRHLKPDTQHDVLRDLNNKVSEEAHGQTPSPANPFPGKVPIKKSPSPRSH